MLRFRTSAWGWAVSVLLTTTLMTIPAARITRADGPKYESREIGEAIELLRQNGTRVSFYPTQFNPFGNGAAQPSSIAYDVDIHSLQPTSKNLSALLVIPRIDRLSLGENFLRDQTTWDTLAQLSEVSILSVKGDLQACDWENIARFPNLNQLNIIRATNLQPQHLWYLEDATQLTRLMLSIEGECEPYFDYLARLPQVHELSLTLSSKQPISLEGIEKLDQLRSLGIDSQQGRGNDLRSIGRLPQLNRLSLAHTFLSDEEMELFRPLNRVTSLNLYDCHLPDNQVEALEGMTALQRVNFSSNKMSDDVLKSLGKSPRIRQVVIRGSQITDAGLKHLYGTRTLQSLQLSATYVTQEGIESLRQARPSLNVIAPLKR